MELYIWLITEAIQNSCVQGIKYCLRIKKEDIIINNIYTVKLKQL